MLRLAAPGNQRFCQANRFDATFGGGEANVAVSLANYGYVAQFVTRMPENDLAAACLMDLHKYGVVPIMSFSEASGSASIFWRRER